jgi:hypothetical protein
VSELDEWGPRLAVLRRRADRRVYIKNDRVGVAGEKARALKRRLQRSPGA